MDITVFRLSLIKDHTIPYSTRSLILSPVQVYALIKEYLQDTDREHIIAIYLGFPQCRHWPQYGVSGDADGKLGAPAGGV